MFGIHPDLRGHTAVVVLVSLGSGAVGLFILWGHFTGAPGLREVPLPVVIVAATFSLLVTYLGIFATPRWYRDASIAFASATPISGTLTLHIHEDNETRSLTGRVDLATGERHDVPLTFPGWDVRPLVGSARAALVYLRSGSSDVVAVVIDRGRLWAMLPPRRAVPGQ
jgi:hypothetical protein